MQTNHGSVDDAIAKLLYSNNNITFSPFLLQLNCVVGLDQQRMQTLLML